jgi:hypothetical protein
MIPVDPVGQACYLVPVVPGRTMVWLTYLTGLGLFTLGVYTKLVWLLTDWTAYLPLAFGLAYTTCGEGMRTLPARRRAFLALAILLSIIILVSLYPAYIHVKDVVDGKPVEWESGKIIQPKQVYQATATATVSLVYLVLGMVAWRRWKPALVKHIKM